ncbi:unnamed protein product, partial [Mesorhabditis belari]|uniref:C3H1-type domain-containing protein n=1 Tax=Mesorhabditis belari TaxID=2138241 RepID=A0AAF3ESP4_9BILA
MACCWDVGTFTASRALSTGAKTGITSKIKPLFISCPQCRSHSNMIVPCRFWPTSPMQKELAKEVYIKFCGYKICKHYQYNIETGRGYGCPRGGAACLNRHQRPDGTIDKEDAPEPIEYNDIKVRTLSDVPSSAPEEISADAQSSTSIRISWKPPPKQNQHGEPVFAFVVDGAKHTIDVERFGVATTTDEKIVIVCANCEDNEQDAKEVFKKVATTEQKQITIPIVFA